LKTERGKTVALAVVSLAIIAAAQVWTITYKHRWSAPGLGVSYTRLAEAFMHGQLSLLQRPDPRLCGLADPYDPRANLLYRLHDASLFNGKYYFYWGPVPALLVAAVCITTGRMHPAFGDQCLVLVLSMGVVVTAMLLLVYVRRRFFPGQAISTIGVAVLSLGAGAPMMFAVARPAIYEAAIVGGQFFLIAGLLVACIGLTCEHRRTLYLTIAGIFWTLSVGSRMSLAPAVGIIAFMTVRRIWLAAPRRWAGCAGIIVPLLIGAVSCAIYNFARFGSIIEFGLRYQLANVNQHAMAASDFSSPRYILPNLVNYLVTAPLFSVHFHYFYADSPRVVNLVHLNYAYRFEPLAGMAWTQPLLILAVATIRWKAADAILQWLRGCLWCAAILGFLPSLMMHGGATRYLMDLTPCCTILAAMGYWRLLGALENVPRLRREMAALARLLVAWQCALGVLLTMQL
jgi:hypothetical protein